MNIYYWLRYLILALFKALLRLLRAVKTKFGDFWLFCRCLTWSTLKEVCMKAGEQRLPGLSAEMAYNSMLALFPGLLAILSAIALFEPLQSTLYQMAGLLGKVIPDEIRNLIRSSLTEILSIRNQQLFSLSFVVSLWAFSGVMSAAMAALDQIHQIPATQTRSFVKAKLISISLSIGTILLLILASGVVFVSDLIVQAIARQSCLLESVANCNLKDVKSCLMFLPDCPLEAQLLGVWRLWRWPSTLGIVSLAFAFVYRYGPSRRHPETPIFSGAVFAALLWAMLSGLFRFYVLNLGNYNWTYGTIGTFIVLLLWLYLCCLAMLIGAQLNVTVGKAMKQSNKW
ncbi:MULTISPECIES: YihY/virulence factor BrkB family protein [unclassified Microcoleus]|uniref:YihY/virulence factor BrkB family protein n=1 Tax=unclassified Microcoleus TaxID=2642155 RepID=UPI001DFECB0D|nr:MULTISPECIES: YihY/virulence factor BrkB family protein [unclassified Microcoleus]MCC3470121.1 YihY/virulence factor BrkB family protein [Microcoleus sp. PH2017_06_SFM_O_A]TAE08590.1 MAG: YihY/virulence factor BrkB family protein [Oscillatoriales cyanobacterium]MCC3413859.1 YihY/virulence factor BrkB family protein [Microcoleus sp. PH2017_02_FOX_O_A]MCC3450320.1 YihY/virulence factor BrkB family protein [Microcoleus sp. PH2017_09_SFU_O_A]MCC3494183.1 YihY/virulence factor BrkB family protei